MQNAKIFCALLIRLPFAVKFRALRARPEEGFMRIWG